MNLNLNHFHLKWLTMGTVNFEQTTESTCRVPDPEISKGSLLAMSGLRFSPGNNNNHDSNNRLYFHLKYIGGKNSHNNIKL